MNAANLHLILQHFAIVCYLVGDNVVCFALYLCIFGILLGYVIFVFCRCLLVCLVGTVVLCSKQLLLLQYCWFWFAALVGLIFILLL